MDRWNIRVDGIDVFGVYARSTNEAHAIAAAVWGVRAGFVSIGLVVPGWDVVEV